MGNIVNILAISLTWNQFKMCIYIHTHTYINICSIKNYNFTGIKKLATVPLKTYFNYMKAAFLLYRNYTDIHLIAGQIVQNDLNVKC